MKTAFIALLAALIAALIPGTLQAQQVAANSVEKLNQKEQTLEHMYKIQYLALLRLQQGQSRALNEQQQQDVRNQQQIVDNLRNQLIEVRNDRARIENNQNNRSLDRTDYHPDHQLMTMNAERAPDARSRNFNGSGEKRPAGERIHDPDSDDVKTGHALK